MNFRQFIRMYESKNTNKDTNNDTKNKEENVDPNTASWRLFAYNLKVFALYIGPTRLSKLLLGMTSTSNQNVSFINTVINEEDPTGRDGTDAPIIRVKDGNLDIVDAKGNSTKMNEGIGTFILASILKSLGATLKQQCKTITADFLGDLLKNFKFNPNTEEDKNNNTKTVKKNNFITELDVRRLNYSIWSENLIKKIQNNSIDNEDKRITWVKKCGNIRFKQVRPLSHKCLNANCPPKEDPTFDHCIVYVCKNYGVKMLLSLLNTKKK